MDANEISHQPKDIFKLLVGSLKLLTFLIAVLYLLFFLGWMVMRAFSSGPTNASGSIAYSPKFFIAVAILIAASGFLIPRTKQLTLALLGFLFVLVQFGFWYWSTLQIKANTGLNRIPGSGPTNLFIGASYFDIVIFFIVLLCVFLTVSAMVARRWSNHESNQN